MTTERKVFFWLLTLTLIGLFLYAVKGVLLPFVVGALVAYFLDPAVDRVERLGAGRSMSTALVSLCFFSLVALVMCIVAPLVAGQVSLLMQELPGYIGTLRQEMMPRVNAIIARIDPAQIDQAKDSLGDISSTALGYASGVLASLWKSGVAVANMFSLIFITPVVAFYLLRDWDKMVTVVDRLLPRANAGEIREQCRIIDRTIGGFVRGQSYVCLLLGMFYAIGLTLAGLKFGLLIGLLTGFLAFIPFVGLLFGMSAGLIVALIQFDDISRTGIVLAIFMVGQFIEGNFIAPRIVGDKVGLHPVWIMFGLLAGGAMFGFVGVLVAVPVSAVIGVVLRYALAKYRASSLYTGGAPTKIPAKRPAAAKPAK